MSRSDPKHLTWIREQGCCVDGCFDGPVHAHHTRGSANSGIGLKPDDRGNTIGLCFKHHHEIHQHGAKTFERKYRLDLSALAAEYAAMSGQEMP